MHRIDSTSNVPVLPAPYPLGTPGYFAHGSAATGTPYTVVTSDWANSVQEEIVSVITAAGLTLDKASNNQLLLALQKVGRIKVYANLNMYVSPTGDDTANGLTPGTPIKTLQLAVDRAYNQYDFQAGTNLIINMAPGTYDQQTGVYVALPGYGAGCVVFNGNTSNPASVVVNLSRPGSCFWVGRGGYASIQGMTLGAPFGQSVIGQIAGTCVGSGMGGIANLSNVIFGASQRSHMEAGGGGWITCRSYQISGGAEEHIISGEGCTVDISQTTITLNNSPRFNYFAWCANGFVYAPNTTFVGSGAITNNARVLLRSGGQIASGGKGFNFFPGSQVWVVGTGHDLDGLPAVDAVGSGGGYYG